MPEQLIESLQESVLAVLAFNNKYGALVAAQVTPENFDGIYNQIAAPVLNYWRRYNKAPGDAHLESLFSRAKLDPGDRRTHALRRALVNLASYSESVNAEYIVNRTQDFVRTQKLKSALLAANERYAQGGENAVPEVEGILNSALKFRQQTLDAGTSLLDVTKSSIFLEKEEGARSLGIPALDRYNLGPTPKRLLLYIAPKNSGKSWFCVHVGRQCLLQGDKVLHITLEMPEHEVQTRYYQSIFGIAAQKELLMRPVLKFDELERLIGYKSSRFRPKLSLADNNIKSVVRNKVARWGNRLKRLRIKEFPSGSLTMGTLQGYLDYLERIEKFVPNVLIIDYPDLFNIDRRGEYRLALGRIFVELRGLGAERNFAVVTPTQSGRDSIGAKRVRSSQVTEDISKVFTADTVLTFSQTAAEATRGLGRIAVEHARSAPKGQEVLIAQSYATGQYVTQSAVMTSDFRNSLNEEDPSGNEETEQQDED